MLVMSELVLSLTLLKLLLHLKMNLFSLLYEPIFFLCLLLHFQHVFLLLSIDNIKSEGGKETTQV